jgi:hypothetical protein
MTQPKKKSWHHTQCVHAGEAPLSLTGDRYALPPQDGESIAQEPLK